MQHGCVRIVTLSSWHHIQETGWPQEKLPESIQRFLVIADASIARASSSSFLNLTTLRALAGYCELLSGSGVGSDDVR